MACLRLLILLFFFLPLRLLAEPIVNIPILCYHNFNPTKPGSMNLTPKTIETQLTWLKENGFTVIPLQEAVEYLEGSRTSLPAKAVVITADDGWQSVYSYLYPIVKKFNVPVTLFIYPQTISTGKNAMTWAQLTQLQQTGLFDVQSHTYSHPNFKQEKKHITSAQFAKLIEHELITPKKILEEKMGHPIRYLAWPFGIYTPELEAAATRAGYEMAFTIDARTANRNYRAMAEPRFMIIQSQSMKTFAAIVNGALSQSGATNPKASKNNG